MASGEDRVRSLGLGPPPETRGPPPPNGATAASPSAPSAAGVDAEAPAGVARPLPPRLPTGSGGPGAANVDADAPPTGVDRPLLLLRSGGERDEDHAYNREGRRGSAQGRWQDRG